MKARSTRAWVAGGLAIAATAGVAALAVAQRASSGHTPLHIGCTHHNHGPKWHADHGRILGGSRSSRLADERDARAAPVAGRSFTASHPAARMPAGSNAKDEQ